MAIYKNKASQKFAVFAYDSTSGAAIDADAGNITATISKDGASPVATNDVNPTELDATDMPGVYLFDLTQAETDADLVILNAVSGTADVLIDPVFVYTQPEERVASNAPSTSEISTAIAALDEIMAMRSFARGRFVVDTEARTSTFYGDDDTTPLFIWTSNVEGTERTVSEP